MRAWWCRLSEGRPWLIILIRWNVGLLYDEFLTKVRGKSDLHTFSPVDDESF